MFAVQSFYLVLGIGTARFRAHDLNIGCRCFRQGKNVVFFENGIVRIFLEGHFGVKEGIERIVAGVRIVPIGGCTIRFCGRNVTIGIFPKGGLVISVIFR